MKRRRDEDEDKGRVKKQRIAVFLEANNNQYFVACYSSVKKLTRALGFMHAANPDRVYTTENVGW